MVGPDFSSIDSMEKAIALYQQGKLEKMLVMPAIFGGADAPPNVLYVPIGIGAIKAETDENVIAPLAEAGKVTRYSAKPRYSGKSFIPTAIHISASDPGSFEFEIKIWGEAINSDE